jgi:hypothetical protein
MDPRSWLRDSDLVAPVQRLLGAGSASVERWSAEAIVRSAGETLGVWRVTGGAKVNGILTPFTVILKGWAAADDAQDPTAWDWPHREVRACASGLLDQLPGGLAAPRCLGEIRCADGTTWAWMTSVSAGALETWTIDHFALVARRLGRFNGAYLAGEPLPRAEWLSRGWTRKWTEAARESIEQFDRYVAAPLVAETFPPAARHALEQLFAARHRWFELIDALPQTFSHLDAYPRNVFLRPRPDGEVTLSLVDWSFTGIAAVGEELVALVSSSFLFGESGDLSCDQLDQIVFPAYVAGLRDAGWHGDERLVRIAFTGSLAMRYLVGTLRTALPVLANPHAEAIVARAFGTTLAQVTERTARHNAWALARADEFQRLVSITPDLPHVA